MGNKFDSFVKVSYLWSGILFIASIVGLTGDWTWVGEAIFFIGLVLSLALCAATYNVSRFLKLSTLVYKLLCGLGVVWGVAYIVWFYFEITLNHLPGVVTSLFHFSSVVLISGPFVIFYRALSSLDINKRSAAKDSHSQ